jgi:geranylgeranyl pyrophosphate synthase
MKKNEKDKIMKQEKEQKNRVWMEFEKLRKIHETMRKAGIEIKYSKTAKEIIDKTFNKFNKFKRRNYEKNN